MRHFDALHGWAWNALWLAGLSGRIQVALSMKFLLSR